MTSAKPDNLRRLGGSPKFWTGVVLGTVLLVACLYNLTNYPTIWWDEAIFSETAANLAQQGRYAFTVQSPDQLADLDFRISVGPAVILPVALAYKLLGVGVTSGRLVAGFYLLFTFGALFWAARRLWGVTTALGAVALALFGTDVLYWGRSVLGDIPALGLFLGGLCFILRGLEEDANLPLFLGGIFLGLAFAAKEFYGLAFIPPGVVLLKQNWGSWRRLAGRLLSYGLGVAMPLLAYLALKVVILGSLTAAVEHFLRQKLLLRHEFFTPLTIGRIYPESVAFLLGHPLFWLGLLGIWLLWRRGQLSLGAKLWIGNFVLWCLVYVTAVYWYRFALPALFLASPLAAYFLLQVAARLVAALSSAPPRWLAPGILAAFVLLFYPLPGADILGAILTRTADPPSRLVNYLRTHIPGKCLIETPEYELVFLDDDHRIHVMPPFYFIESTPEKVVLLNPRGRPYDFAEVKADYLILGSFGKSVFKQVYSPPQVARKWRKIAQVDFYDIYIPRQRGKASWPSVMARRPRTKDVKKNGLPLTQPSARPKTM
ncbi:MAG: glycosyltransferase family 39 protein [Thermodesulfobacteriota bacterium]